MPVTKGIKMSKIEQVSISNKYIAVLEAENDKLLEALKEIAKCEGEYSTDSLKFAENVIENIVAIAEEAIRKAER